MLNKDLTIKKAIRKYHLIYPITGKKAIDDCFIFLRGEAFFQFRTKDKKVHTMKACTIRPVTEEFLINREMVSAIIKLVNRPILIRSLLFRKVRKYTGISALCNGSELQRLLQV